MNRQFYKVLYIDGSEVYEHRLIAERILGRSLKEEELVHHVDENGLNNEHKNLVICPDGDYHKLLHYRARAFDESGDANFIKCEICGKWDDKKNITTIISKPEKKYRNYRTRNYHPKCNSQKAAAYYAKKRSLKALGYTYTVL